MSKPVSKWLGFAWELNEQLDLEKPTPRSYGIKLVKEEDREELREVIDKSIALDPSWNSSLHEIRPWIDRTIEEVMGKESAAFLALRHGSRIIGATILDCAMEEQFAIGPCVLVEYRNRGFGTQLLAAALRHIRGTGAGRAAAITRDASLAARFLYPKFGGKSYPATPLVAA